MYPTKEVHLRGGVISPFDLGLTFEVHEILDFAAEVEIKVQADRRNGDEDEGEHPNDVPRLEAALNENDFPFGAGVVKGIVRGMRVSHW
jgi:hypothetical protein